MTFDYYDWAEFESYLNHLPAKDAAKLTQTIANVEKYGAFIASQQQWICYVGDKISEIRSQQANNIQRALYFSLGNAHYLITHGFSKKDPKTPLREINKAKRRRRMFLKGLGQIE